MSEKHKIHEHEKSYFITNALAGIIIEKLRARLQRVRIKLIAFGEIIITHHNVRARLQRVRIKLIAFGEIIITHHNVRARLQRVRIKLIAFGDLKSNIKRGHFAYLGTNII